MVFISSAVSGQPGGRNNRASLASSKFSTPFPVIRGLDGTPSNIDAAEYLTAGEAAARHEQQQSGYTFLGDTVRSMIWCKGADGRPELLCAGDRGLSWLEHHEGALSIESGHPGSGTASELGLTDTNRPVRLAATEKGVVILATIDGCMFTVDPSTRSVNELYSPAGSEEDSLLDFDVTNAGHIIATISARGGLKVFHINVMQRGPVYRRPVSGSSTSTGGGPGVVLSGSSSCRFVDAENILAVTSGRHIQLFDLRVSPTAAASSVLSLPAGAAGSLSTSLTCLSTYPESGVLCAGDSEGRLHVWDWRNGKSSATQPTVSRLAHSVNTNCCCEMPIGAASAMCMVSGGVDGQLCRWTWSPDSSAGKSAATAPPRDHNGERQSKSERRWWPGLTPVTDSPPSRVWKSKVASGASIQRFSVDLNTAVLSIAVTEGPNGNSVVAYSTDTGVVGIWTPNGVL